jgi:hypothetical protein
VAAAGALAGAALVAGPARVASRWNHELEHPVHADWRHFRAGPAAFVRATAHKLEDPLAWTPLDRDGGIGFNPWATVAGLVCPRLPPRSVVAYDQMGQVPYLCGREHVFVDTWGLTDQSFGYHAFARRVHASPVLTLYDRAATAITRFFWPDHRRHVSDAALLDDFYDGRRPDVILLNRVSARLARSAASLLAADPRLAARYRRVGSLGTTDVFARHGLAFELPPPEARGGRARRSDEREP